jgi:hypothetical protein
LETVLKTPVATFGAVGKSTVVEVFNIAGGLSHHCGTTNNGETNISQAGNENG